MSKQSKQTGLNYLINILIILGITGLVLWLTVRNYQDSLTDILHRMDIKWMFVILVIVIAIRVIVGINLTIETRLTCPDYKVSQGIITAYIGSLVNEITPSASGGQFVQVYIFKRQGVDLSTAAGVLWMDFILYQSTLVGSVFLLILLKFKTFYQNYSQFFLIVLFGFALNVAVIGNLYVLARFRPFYEWLSKTGLRIALKLHIIKDRDSAERTLNVALEKFEQQTKQIKEHKEMIPKVVGLYLVRLLLYYATPYFCALALHIEVLPSQLLSIMALSSFVSMVNAFLPMPGSSGGTEATFLLMFSTIFPGPSAASIMIVWRFMTYFVPIILGAIVFVYERTLKPCEKQRTLT